MRSIARGLFRRSGSIQRFVSAQPDAGGDAQTAEVAPPHGIERGSVAHLAALCAATPDNPRRGEATGLCYGFPVGVGQFHARSASHPPSGGDRLHRLEPRECATRPGARGGRRRSLGTLGIPLRAGPDRRPEGAMTNERHGRARPRGVRAILTACSVAGAPGGDHTSAASIADAWAWDTRSVTGFSDTFGQRPYWRGHDLKLKLASDTGAAARRDGSAASRQHLCTRAMVLAILQAGFRASHFEAVPNSGWQHRRRCACARPSASRAWWAAA